MSKNEPDFSCMGSHHKTPQKSNGAATRSQYLQHVVRQYLSYGIFLGIYIKIIIKKISLWRKAFQEFSVKPDFLKKKFHPKENSNKKKLDANFLEGIPATCTCHVSSGSHWLLVMFQCMLIALWLLPSSFFLIVSFSNVSCCSWTSCFCSFVIIWPDLIRYDR